MTESMSCVLTAFKILSGQGTFATVENYCCLDDLAIVRCLLL